MSGWALLGNILWVVFGAGVGCFLFWLVAGAVLAVTVVGIPFAFAAFRISTFALFPFGRRLVDVDAVGGSRVPGTTLANVLWVVLAGIWLGLFHLVAGVALCLTIVGIPFGLAHFKLAGISLAPLGKRAVPSEYFLPRVA